MTQLFRKRAYPPPLTPLHYSPSLQPQTHQNQVSVSIPPMANLVFNICHPMASQKSYQIKGSNFPFGVLGQEGEEGGKRFVHKRYSFRDDAQFDELMEKVDKLKTISHRNTINLRSFTKNEHSLDLIYQYVPYSLEEAFTDHTPETVKQMHRQFIELAIYLAKNCVLTSFSALRCGVVVNQGRTILKYYLPLQELTLTNNRSALERAVQLFNVQSMLYLDSLASQALNSTINENSSQRTFRNRAKLFAGRERRDSQPSASPSRKLSNLTKESQIRKLSTLSRELSEISLMHKKRGASTRVSGESFHTFRSILSLKSQEGKPKPQLHLNSSQETLKRSQSQSGMGQGGCLQQVKERSKRALESLGHLREKMKNYKGFLSSLMKIKEQH